MKSIVKLAAKARTGASTCRNDAIWQQISEKGTLAPNR